MTMFGVLALFQAAVGESFHRPERWAGFHPRSGNLGCGWGSYATSNSEPYSRSRIVASLEACAELCREDPDICVAFQFAKGRCKMNLFAWITKNDWYGAKGFSLDRVTGDHLCGKGTIFVRNGCGDCTGGSTPSECYTCTKPKISSETAYQCKSGMDGTETQLAVKGARLSSKYGFHHGVDLEAKLAFDGDTSTMAHSSGHGETAPWLEADLGEQHTVTTVKITNRPVCRDRLVTGLACDSNITPSSGPYPEGSVIGVSDEPCFGDSCGGRECGRITRLKSTDEYTITCVTPLTGRYVYLQLPGKNRMINIMEMEIFGSDELTDTKVKSCGEGLEWVNHIYDNPGKITCECYPIGDQCLKDEQCEEYPDCTNLEPSDDVIFQGTYFNGVLPFEETGKCCTEEHAVCLACEQGISVERWCHGETFAHTVPGCPQNDLDWTHIASGRLGEAGCSKAATTSNHRYGHSLEKCQELCLADGASYVQYHADTWCGCFETCPLTRPASNYFSRADVYHYGEAKYEKGRTINTPSGAVHCNDDSCCNEANIIAKDLHCTGSGACWRAKVEVSGDLRCTHGACGMFQEGSKVAGSVLCKTDYSCKYMSWHTPKGLMIGGNLYCEVGQACRWAKATVEGTLFCPEASSCAGAVISAWACIGAGCNEPGITQRRVIVTNEGETCDAGCRRKFDSGCDNNEMKRLDTDSEIKQYFAAARAECSRFERWDYGVGPALHHDNDGPHSNVCLLAPSNGCTTKEANHGADFHYGRLCVCAGIIEISPQLGFTGRRLDKKSGDFDEPTQSDPEAMPAPAY